MNGDKSLHPFFQRSRIEDDGHESASGDEIKVTHNVGQFDGAQEHPTKSKAAGLARKGRPSALTKGKTQKTLQEIVNPRASDPEPQNGTEKGMRASEIPASCSSEPVFSSPRPKRRRTSQNQFVTVEGPNGVSDNAVEPRTEEAMQRESSPQVFVSPSSPLAPRAPAADEAVSSTPPKKMLRLNASGKFSSPIKKEDMEVEAPVEAPKRRGRPRKSKEPVVAKSLIATIKYGQSEGIGPKIDRILSGEERHEVEVKTSTPKKRNTQRKQQPSKPTHPFFLGKPKEDQPPPKQVSPRKASAVTPGKLRRQTMSERSPNKTSARAASDYAVGSGLLKDRLMFRHPGAKEPAFPTREQAHVRGLDEQEAANLHRATQFETPIARRKRKAAKLPFPAKESLLRQLSIRLKPEEDGNLRSDGFREPHPSLTLPKKLLIPGHEILRRLAPELSLPLNHPDEDELVHPTPSEVRTHAAVQKLHERIATSLSAFDEGRGVTLSWLQKFEPIVTAEVLQPRKEAAVLKDWLTSLTVTAVEGTSKSEAKVGLKSDLKPRKKRRRKHGDMDEFLVDDDDEDVLDMDELSDAEDATPRSTNTRKVAKSVVQVTGNGAKLSNAVLLSGPHGCGKTAAAHAVAKELGFKVFEISPCERRSGKDVLDKVGDMTENHLVKHHGTEGGETSSAEEPSKIDEAFQRDLVSGRQGKMNAFFTPKTKVKPPSPKKAAQKKKVIEAVQKALKKPPKEQQQSLILLEEVDILFKDDKDFWGTIFKLIESSKRPFIMTCNEEDLVPLQAMSLHAILRFSPPSNDLVADYLLSMAATEGHLLRRDAVSSLYESTGRDLRASIAELNFWCQMGVGDPRGGLSWIFQRYPHGSDLDVGGRRLRVVSEGTYAAGMGLLPDRLLDSETQLLWAEREFEVESDDIFSLDDLPWDELPSLERFSRLADSTSAADVYGGHPLACRLDPTQPPMAAKSRGHYVDGMSLLQADERIEYLDISTQLFIATTLRAHFIATNLKAEDVRHKLSKAIQSARQITRSHARLTRQDFACFDAISIPSENSLFTGLNLTQSAFDGPLEPIVTDLAPFVRSIVSYDLALAEQRERLTGHLSHGRQAKRARTSRAAIAALEGGQRGSTRREKWFSKELNVEAVLATAGKDWPNPGLEAGGQDSKDGTETPASSLEAASSI